MLTWAIGAIPSNATSGEVLSTGQIVLIIGAVVGIIGTVLGWPATVRRWVLKRLGRWPIAANNERSGVDRQYPSGPIYPADDPRRAGVRSVVLHLYNHADHQRHVIVNEDSQVIGPKEARLIRREFSIQGHTGMNLVLTLTAPPHAWTDAPVVRLKLRGSTDAGERVRWRGAVMPLPYDYSGPVLGYA
jgi:hypothetical protein